VDAAAFEAVRDDRARMLLMVTQKPRDVSGLITALPLVRPQRESAW
jgi:hypothetical protein